MRIITKAVVDLTSEEYQRCQNLNMREKGEMLGSLIHARKGLDDNHAIMAVEDDLLLGWALLHYFVNTPFVSVYVRRSMRRRGIGTKLLMVAHERWGDFSYRAWDERSSKFFSQFDGLKIEAKYQKLLREKDSEWDMPVTMAQSSSMTLIGTRSS